MKAALVCGAGGFIGGHLVKRLKREGYWVRGVDVKEQEFAPSAADELVETVAEGVGKKLHARHARQNERQPTLRVHQ